VMFTFFYSSIVLNTRDVADNLKKTGAFIPGIRQGNPTQEFLEQTMNRITFAGAVFLALIAILPSTRKARPPNIFFSVMPGPVPIRNRIRSASSVS